MTNHRMILGCVAAVALAGCVAGPSGQSEPVAAQADASGRIAAECALYEAAMKRDAAKTGTSNTQIVLGCPGYEDVKDTSNRFTGAGAFIGAMRAQPPQAALAMGPAGKNLYQKMIARGVPTDVANAIVSDPVFARAVAAYS